jgi:signal transduction histidine kinase
MRGGVMAAVRSFGLTQTSRHLLAFTLGLGVIVVLLRWANRHTDRTGITEFALFSSAVAAWLGFQALEIGTDGETVAYYASFAVRGARAAMTVAWFYFTTTYAGYGRAVRSPPIRTVVAVATGYLFVVTAVPPVAARVTFPTIEYVAEPLGTVAFAGVTPVRMLSQTVGYTLVLAGTVAAGYRLAAARYTDTWRVALFVGAVASVVVFDYVVEKAIPPVDGVDYAVLGTTATVTLFVLTLYSNDLLGRTPVGRDDVVQAMEAPVFVVDDGGRIVDHNAAAARAVPTTVSVGRGLSAVFTEALESDETTETDATVESGVKTAETADTAAVPHTEATETTDTAAVPNTEATETTDTAVVANAEAGEAGVADGGTVTFERDGEPRQYDVAVTEFGVDGTPRGSLVVLRDVTERIERERQLRRQNERLDEFASVVGHDLRNPLNVAQGRVALARELLDGDDDNLEAAAEAHDRIERLLDDLLTLARAGEEVGETSPVSLERAAERCWGYVSTADATLDVAETVTIRADESRFEQLLENLFHNAVEHGGQDVTVTVGVLDDERGVYVADDGPGVPASDRDRVFESGYTTSDDGTGFGLHIVRDIADAHGWRVRLTESADGGARVELLDVSCVGR